MTTEEIRARIAELMAEMRLDENGELTLELKQPVYDLADILVARGHACFACLFGQYPKTARCRHD